MVVGAGGTVLNFLGRRVLYKLRNRIFTKLQDLPVAFFNVPAPDIT